MFSYYEQYVRFLYPIRKFENCVHFLMQYTIEIILSLPERITDLLSLILGKNLDFGRCLISFSSVTGLVRVFTRHPSL